MADLCEPTELRCHADCVSRQIPRDQRPCVQRWEAEAEKKRLAAGWGGGDW